MNGDERIEDLLRPLAPQVLGALVRRFGHFDACEDAVQEALLAAFRQWPGDGIPANPRGWLVTVASRRLIDELRRDEARRQREDADAVLAIPDDFPQSIGLTRAVSPLRIAGMSGMLRRVKRQVATKRPA